MVMKNMFLSIILFLFIIPDALSQEIHSNRGKLLGVVDVEKYYDGAGRLAGWLEEDGKVYNVKGRCIGWLEKDTFYDGIGRQLGQLQGERLYDASGMYAGDIRNGRLHNRKGRLLLRAENLTHTQILVFYYFFLTS
jgi:hypothetical protein